MKDVGLYDGKYRFCTNCNKLSKYKKALVYFKTEEELIEIFNKKWATIILSLESKFGGCNLA